MLKNIVEPDRSRVGI